MYVFMLGLHNILRWVMLLCAVAMVVRCWQGLAGRGTWGELDGILGRVLVIVTDVQLLVGLILYIFLSPMTRAAFSDFGGAMRIPGLRFFAVEHLTLMLLAVVFVHIGWASVKRASEAGGKLKKGVLWFTLGLIALLVGIPWEQVRLLPRGF